MTKVAIITGASSGIGKAFAKSYVKSGGKVALLARRKEKLDELANELNNSNDIALSLQTDVSSAKQVEIAFKKTIAKWGRVDVVLNNAALINPIGKLENLNDDELLKLLNVNIFGAMIVAKYAINQFKKQQTTDCLINISSGAAHKPKVGWSAYCSSKAAMDMLTKVIGKENNSKNFCAFSIAPGVVDSEMQAEIRNTSNENFPDRQRFVDLHTNNQLAKPSEVADVLLHLSKSNLKSIHGKIVDIRDRGFQEMFEDQNFTFPIIFKK